MSIHARTAAGGGRALLIADATGATPTWIVAESQGEGDLGPTQAWWAPDGRSLAFVHRGSVGDPFDEDLHVVVPGATQSGAAPSLWPWRWLADGSIVGMRAEGEVVRVALTTSLGLEEQIRARGMIDIGIGDDGQVLAEAERTDGAFAVSWVSSAGVHDPTEVLVSTERFEVERAQWSPGGDLVAVVNPGDERVHVIDVGDGGPRVVLDAPAARWSNSNDVLESPWSPDGRALVVRRNDGIRVHRRGGSGFASELTIANTDRVSWYGWQPAR